MGQFVEKRYRLAFRQFAVRGKRQIQDDTRPQYKGQPVFQEHMIMGKYYWLINSL